MAELYERLLPAAFNDVHFPVTRMRMRIAHELVRHGYWGVDGARVEATGMAPMEFNFSVPWVNGIVPGKNEKWVAGRLYPGAMRSFLVMFARKKTGILQHPEFGKISVKAHTCDIDWTGERRGGPEAELTFVETLVDGDGAFLERASPIGDLIVAAEDLDASERDLRALVPTLPKYKGTFADLARAVTGVVDQVGLLQQRTAGQVDTLAYRVNSMQDSLERSGLAKTHSATKNIEIIKSSTHDLRKKLLAVGRDVILYSVPYDTTIAGLTCSLEDTSLADVIKLNPALMSSPVVPKGALIRYYRAKVAA